MKILYLCHRIPYPPNKGEKIRAFHQVRALAAHHEVDLFTLVDDPKDLLHREALAAYCHQLTLVRMHPKLARLRSLPYLFTRTPLTLPCFYSAELRTEVRRALSTRSYDLIFVYCSSMAQYVEPAGGIPVVMDLVDVDSDKWSQYAKFTKFPMSAVYRREAAALRRYERSVCQGVSCVLVSTEREARLMREIAAGVKVHVSTNGVDTDFFSRESIPYAPGAATIVFTGDMGYFPNAEAVVYFTSMVFPKIRQAVPEAQFSIVGRNPGPRVRALGQLGGVEVTGFVPDVRTYLSQARVAVAPFTIAAGVQNKILEAMSYGLPVVATSRTVQGLANRTAALVEIGDTPDEMAAKVVLLLRDAGLCGRLGAAGRHQVAEDYRWEQAERKLMELLENPAATPVGDCSAPFTRQAE